MSKYYVDIGLQDCGYGAGMNCHDVIEAETLEKALNPKNLSCGGQHDVSMAPIPIHMQQWEKDRILDNYKRLHEQVGDKLFYERIVTKTGIGIKTKFITESGFINFLSAVGNHSCIISAKFE